MQITEKCPDLFSAIACLSSHIGLITDAEKQLRQKQEAYWMDLLDKETLGTFLEMWYSQPLFSSLKTNPNFFSETLERRKYQDTQALKMMFEEFALSKQPFFDINTLPCCFFYGEEDERYKELYLEQKWHVPIEKIPKSGHAVHIENPDGCASKLKKWLNSRNLTP